MADVSADPARSDGRKQERRRGASLEDAILDAAWEQLTAEGYGHFTIETVAARARTSKPVLYRRWKTSDELLHAAIRHRGTVTELPDPDTGTLRGDFLALLHGANTLRSDMAALMSSMLGSYYDQAGLAPADLRAEFIGGRTTATQRAIDRAVGRGEIDPARLTPRIASLPFDLWRHEVMMTLKPVPDHVLRQIVDDIFIPLVARRDEPDDQQDDRSR
jgi:AcrR family transcriptional regulator